MKLFLTRCRRRWKETTIAFTFILGIFPMVIAVGAGSSARRAIGTTVFTGMLAATLFGIMMIPALYVLFQTLREKGHAVRLKLISRMHLFVLLLVLITSLFLFGILNQFFHNSLSRVHLSYKANHLIILVAFVQITNRFLDIFQNVFLFQTLNHLTFQVENIEQGIDQALAFIEMVILIFFYLLTTITIVKLTLKDKFKVTRPFKNFRWVALSLILIIIILIRIKVCKN